MLSSSGCATFAGFPRHIIPQCHTEIIPFLHICQTGLATNPDIIAESSIDLDGTLRRSLTSIRELICGIKARMVSPALRSLVWRCPGLPNAPPASGIKLMVHIGDTTQRYDPTVIRSLLPLLDDGDILTHYFTANAGGVLDTNGHLVPGRVRPRLGCVLDTAHGRSNFSFDVGRRVIDQGCYHTVSALTSRCRVGSAPCIA